MTGLGSKEMQNTQNFYGAVLNRWGGCHRSTKADSEKLMSLELSKKNLRCNNSSKFLMADTAGMEHGRGRDTIPKMEHGAWN